MTKRMGTRIAVVATLALVVTAAVTSVAGARRYAFDSPASAISQTCANAGGSYDSHAWRAPEDAFGGFSCTFVTFAGPAALSGVDPALRDAVTTACSRSGRTLVTIATFTYVGYGCVWLRS